MRQQELTNQRENWLDCMNHSVILQHIGMSAQKNWFLCVCIHCYRIDLTSIIEYYSLIKRHQQRQKFPHVVYKADKFVYSTWYCCCCCCQWNRLKSGDNIVERKNNFKPIKSRMHSIYTWNNLSTSFIWTLDAGRSHKKNVDENAERISICEPIGSIFFLCSFIERIDMVNKSRPISNQFGISSLFVTIFFWSSAFASLSHSRPHCFPFNFIRRRAFCLISTNSRYSTNKVLCKWLIVRCCLINSALVVYSSCLISERAVLLIFRVVIFVYQFVIFLVASFHFTICAADKRRRK